MALTREQYLSKVPLAYQNNLYYKKYKEDPNFWNKFAEENTASESWDYKTLPWDIDHDGVKAINKTQNKFYVQSTRTPSYESWSPKLNQQPIYLDNDPENREWDVYLNAQGNPAFYPRKFSQGETPVNPPFHLASDIGDAVDKEQIFDKAAQDTRAGGNTRVQSGGAGTNDQVPTNQINTKFQKYYPQWRDPYTTSTGLTEQDTPEQSNTKGKYLDLDWNHLYDLAKSANAIGLAYKNWRIADAAERPILHDPVEHHHAVYGDYFAKTQGQQNAGNLLNAASRPITSDMAQTHASQLQSQIAANDAINQGNLVDNQKREQTSEIAWQQEKENKNIRHDVAMANRGALYQTDFNRADLKQQRNAYIHKEFENILGAWQKDYQDFRNERKKYQDLYDQEFAVTNGINSYIASNNIDPNLKLRAHQYLYQPSTFNKWYSEATDDEKAQMFDIIKGGTTQGHLDYYKNKGVRIQQAAQGGNLQKAILKKRQKDADRFAKQMEESNKRIQKAVFKSIDRMYRTKYQHGGGLVAFNSTPVRTPSETFSPPYWHPLNASSASADKKKDSAGSKINDLLKTSKALDIDRAYIEKEINKVMSLGDTSLDSSQIESQALQIQSKIKKAEQDYDLAVKVSENLQKNGGDKEAYIDTNGLVMVYDKESGYTKVPASEALQHEHIVTNAEALQYRNSDPKAAFNSNLIFDLMAGIGMKAVYQNIEEVCKQLGHEDNFRHAIGKIENGQVTMGTGSIISDLYKDVEKGQISLADGLYELKNHNKDNYNELVYALNTLYKSLSAQEQALITLKAQKSEQSNAEFLLEMLYPKRVIEKDIDTEIKSVKDHERKASSKEAPKEMTVPLMMSDILGHSGTTEVANLLIGGDFKHNPGSVGITAEVHRGVLTIDNKRVTSDIPLNGVQLLNKSDIKSYTDTSKATFLGEDIADWSKVLLEDSYFYKVMLPTKSDGTPNLQVFEKLKTVIKNLNEAGITNAKNKKITAEDFNNINQNFKSEESKKQLEVALLGQGLKIQDISNFKPFLFCYASAGEQAFNQTHEGFFSWGDEYKIPEIQLKLDGNNKTKYQSIINKMNKASGYSSSDSNSFKEDSIGEIYNGAIYIPLRYDVLGSDNTQYTESLLDRGTASRKHELETKDFTPKANTIKSNK